MDIQAALVRSILEQWGAYTWTVQGFGFIRTKLANVGRIHVWDSRLATSVVSTMHTHPWPLRSTIISGELINCRFARHPEGRLSYMQSLIKTGEGGGLDGESRELRLIGYPPESYTTGDTYEQEPTEIHRTIAQDGTVTLITRPQGPPLELAEVFWPRGTEWVSAEPQTAQPWQVDMAISYALQRWNAA